MVPDVIWQRGSSKMSALQAEKRLHHMKTDEALACLKSSYTFSLIPSQILYFNVSALLLSTYRGHDARVTFRWRHIIVTS